jgi:L-serine dehydratase
MRDHVDSIFETFRVGAGPSSSHSIGPQRAAQLFLAQLTRPPSRVRVILRGSLAATGKGHLTDQTLAAALGDLPHEIVWDTTTPTPRHPNTLVFEALDDAGVVTRAWTAYSGGGGSLADDTGPVGEAAPVRYPIRTLTQALALCEEAGLTYWQFVERQERDVWPRLERIWAVMRDSVERGLRNTRVLLPGSLRLARRARTTSLRAQALQSPQRDLALVSSFALAVAEENADAGTIVTAPSCGPAGVVPGLLYYFETEKGVARDEILHALATAGLIGSIIRANASVSGAEVGCQGEIGSACSMAAAAGSQLLGGTLRQIEYAAEMGMEHHLGLTCDPVEGYVQIPCIERNMTACLRAIECASFSLLTDGRHLVSFDDVIEVMYRTGVDLQARYRETGGGGLAEIWRRRAHPGAPPAPAPNRSCCD